MSESIRQAFLLQAQFCDALHSPLTAQVLRTLADTLDRNTRTGARILDWPGDPMRDALKLRIAGGLNALARSGQDAELSGLYVARDGNFAGILPRVLKEWDDWLFPWLDSAPQTNEVARSGVLWPGLSEVARRFGPRIDLLELGASAGLNLNMDRFGYDLGGIRSGEAASGVQLRPQWEGPAPPSAPVEIVARAGVDLNPLDVRDDAVADRLMAYIWPDQDERVARTAAAIVLARQFPPPLVQADAAEWVEDRLASPQTKGVTRVIYHSIALQYLPAEGRARVRKALKTAGNEASASRPLAWLFMEFQSESALGPDLCLRCWPGGPLETLAHCHPHGATVQWLGQ